MIDRRNLAIGVLSTTATVLLVGLLVVESQSPVQASGLTESTGEFVLTVGSVSLNDEELVYLINNQKERMVCYRFDNRTGKIDLVEGINLADMRAAAQTAPAPAANPGRRKP